jgi:hypothetical protein
VTRSRRWPHRAGTDPGTPAGGTNDFVAHHDNRADGQFPGPHALLGHGQRQRDELIGRPGFRHLAIFPHGEGGIATRELS